MNSNSKKELLIMKFLHYFITEKNYKPVIVHGVQNEIWLENMDSDYKIIRIVTNYIHNKEQFDFDNFKVSKLVRQIKMKTFTFKMKVMSFYLDVNDDVNLENTNINFPVRVKNEKSLSKNDLVKDVFSDMNDKLKFTEQGALLYEKINNDIMKKNLSDNKKLNDLFSFKKPIVTYILIAVMSIMMILMYLLGNGSSDINTLYLFGGLVKNNEVFRIFTSIFLHIGILHFIMNIWALKILGTQTENFYGHLKTFIIFVYSGVVGNLISLLFMNESIISAGASGAIFGLMGAILYFAFNQRTYMAEALKKEILPVIIINLLLGFMLPSINMYAHVGGLISGILISNSLGIKYKTSKFEKINGIICSILLVLILAFFCYFM